MAHIDLKAGDRIAEYLLLEKLGEGVLGEVWKARPADRLTPIVAIKVAVDPERFREVRSMGTQPLGLDHPGVVRTVGLNIAHDPPYTVMEYVEGRSLRKALEGGQRLSFAESAEMIAQVLDVLEYAHERGVIHGNLKPENLLLENACGKLRVRVADFGPGMVARAGVPTVGRSLAYLAPENRQGEWMNVRSDLYAAGVVLFEALTGRVPVGEELPSEAAEGVPVMLDGVVRKALRAQADRRYGTAKEMKEDLAACVAGARSARTAQAEAPKSAPRDNVGEVKEQVKRIVDDVKSRQSLDLGRAFSDVADALSTNAVPLLLGGLLMGLMSLASGFILAGPLAAGMYKMLLRVVREKQIVQVGDVFSSFDRFWSKAFGFWVIAVATVIGFSFMLLPGLLVSALCMYVFLLMVDRQLSFSAALNESTHLVWKHGLFMHTVIAGMVILMGGASTIFPHSVLAFWLCLPVLYGLVTSAYVQVMECEARGFAPVPGFVPSAKAA